MTVFRICAGFAGFKRVSGGYRPGDCGVLTIYRDGTYNLKAFGLIVVRE